jgi:polyhydroxyalkanoate synthesis repressor PhaR
MVMSESPEVEQAEQRRVIKRYSNRKLYDTKDSRYVTLLQIAEMIRANEDVQIIDNATKEDKTDVTLALIISEELKAKPRGIPLATLKALIRQRGEKILTQLRDGPMSRFIPEKTDDAEKMAPQEEHVSTETQPSKGIRGTIEQWQHAIDDRIRAVLPTFSTIRELQAEVLKLGERLEALEKRLPPKSEE